MISTSKQKNRLGQVLFRIFGRDRRRAGMTGIESVVRWVFLLIFGAFFVIPLIWLVIAPSKSVTELYDRSISPLAFGHLSGYVQAWNNILIFGKSLMFQWLANSIYFSLSSVLLSVAVAIPSGYVLATMKFKGRQVVMWLTLICMILPASALVLPLFLEMNALRLVGTPLSVILPSAFYPFGVYLAYVFYSVTMPKDLLLAGKVDGCNEWQLFWHIGMPLGRTLIATLGFLTFNGAWNNYILPFYMLNHQETYNLPLGVIVLVNGCPFGHLCNREAPVMEPERALGALIMVVPVILVFLFAQRYIVAGISAGAVKE